ncbi:hypothetical protein SDC9_203592 [bioreactor metagenome]|uniref:Uncharacterized protein n=1 Tax=bioreactor metagenome TaxID=1076179 RepID=A0A645IWX3_9ZZZZ
MTGPSPTKTKSKGTGILLCGIDELLHVGNSGGLGSDYNVGITCIEGNRGERGVVILDAFKQQTVVGLG